MGGPAVARDRVISTVDPEARYTRLIQQTS
jgi:hypothetical protein